MSAPDAGVAPFGLMPDGAAVGRVVLRAGGVSAAVITLGAALQSLEVPDRTGRLDDIVLGHDGLAGYLAHRSFFGATIGRVANRIAGGRFELDGTVVQLARNDGDNSLHGGPEGFDRRNWQILERTPEAVTLGLISPDGDQGFPGRLQAQVSYALHAEAEGAVCLSITHSAVADAPTPVAMTNHSFFALAGAAALAARPQSALEYRLTVAASRYLPVDAHRIPTAVLPVGATPFDFRTGRAPATAMRCGAVPGGYDHCLCLDAPADGHPGAGNPAAPPAALPPAALPVVAELFDPVSGRRMELMTDQPGLQVYTGNFLDGSVTGKLGHAYQAHDAICLEPQSWPDALNMPAGWGGGDILLRPGARYLARMALRFSTRG